MGLPGLLRGSRRWSLLLIISILAIIIHALWGLFQTSSHSYNHYEPAAYQVNQRPHDASDPLPHEDYQAHPFPNVEQDPTSLRALSGDTAIKAVADQAPAVTASSPGPPPQSDNIKPHKFGKAEDFLPHFASLSKHENLTVATAIGTCNYSPAELEQFGYGTNHAWVQTNIPSDTIAHQREQWQHFIANDMVPYSHMPTASSDSGIVVVAGHPMAMKRFVVLVRTLRDLGSKLPIELAYWGPEVNETVRDALKTEFPTVSLLFTDLSSPKHVYHSPRQYTSDIHINFQLKLSAILNSRFARPLLLDSDNLPVRDPTPLWSSSTFLEFGSLFYPDIARMRPQNPLFAITNTPCARDVYEFESGQVLVDKQRFWYHLQLADWFLGQDWYKPFLLGDKDTFRFAWNALKTDYGRPKKWVTTVGLSLLQPKTPLNSELNLPEQTGRDGKELVREFCGHSFAQAHPDTGEVYFVHGGTLKSFSAPLLELLQQQKSGVFVEYKRSALDERWGEIEYDVRLKYMSAGYAYREAGYEMGDVVMGDDASLGGSRLTDQDLASTVMCSDMAHVVARPIGEIGLAGLEGAFARAGGYWMIGEQYRPGTSGA